MTPDEMKKLAARLRDEATRQSVQSSASAFVLTGDLLAAADLIDSITAPEGWKLVPVEPTEAILDVLYDNWTTGQARRSYQALLAVAPQPGDSDER